MESIGAESMSSPQGYSRSSSANDARTCELLQLQTWLADPPSSLSVKSVGCLSKAAPSEDR